MTRKLVLGDIHGGHKALLQVLERSQFNDDDTLIFLGDVADGWPQTNECIETLIGIPNLIHLLGNHDEWMRQWTQTGRRDRIWTTQGGQNTIDSYGSLDDVPDSHAQYLEDALLWHEDDERIFVHAGWPYSINSHPVAYDLSDELYWNRSLYLNAVQSADAGMDKITKWKEVYIGHTSTWNSSEVPHNVCEVWNMDQGAGWSGKLSIMDIDTKEFWQSDVVSTLYPNEIGR